MQLIGRPGAAGDPRPRTEALLDLARLKAVVRDQLELSPETPVVISELQCSEPGCPPLETVVAVLDDSGPTWKLHMSRAQVTPEVLRSLIVEQPQGGHA